MLNLISPTGREVRGMDSFGSGAFRAPRKDHVHQGVDYVCVPGQEIVAPVSGTLVRECLPYADDLRWSGCILQNPDIYIRMFYFRPNKNLKGTWVQQGDVIGIAQNISNKYNTYTEYMLPHIHLEIRYINPEALRRETT